MDGNASHALRGQPGGHYDHTHMMRCVCILAFSGIAGVFLVTPCPEGDEADQPALVLSSPSFRSRLRRRSASPASSTLRRQQSWLSPDEPNHPQCRITSGSCSPSNSLASSRRS